MDYNLKKQLANHITSVVQVWNNIFSLFYPEIYNLEIWWIMNTSVWTFLTPCFTNTIWMKNKMGTIFDRFSTFTSKFLVSCHYEEPRSKRSTVVHLGYKPNHQNASCYTMLDISHRLVNMCPTFTYVHAKYIRIGEI